MESSPSPPPRPHLTRRRNTPPKMREAYSPPEVSVNGEILTFPDSLLGLEMLSGWLIDNASAPEAPTLGQHAAAKNVLTAGATLSNGSPNKMNPMSSIGPIRENCLKLDVVPPRYGHFRSIVPQSCPARRQHRDGLRHSSTIHFLAFSSLATKREIERRMLDAIKCASRLLVRIDGPRVHGGDCSFRMRWCGEKHRRGTWGPPWPLELGGERHMVGCLASPIIPHLQLSPAHTNANCLAPSAHTFSPCGVEQHCSKEPIKDNSPETRSQQTERGEAYRTRAQNHKSRPLLPAGQSTGQYRTHSQPPQTATNQGSRLCSFSVADWRRAQLLLQGTVTRRPPAHAGSTQPEDNQPPAAIPAPPLGPPKKIEVLILNHHRIVLYYG